VNIDIPPIFSSRNTLFHMLADSRLANSTPRAAPGPKKITDEIPDPRLRAPTPNPPPR
jgi:hypothetical protein